MLKKHKRLHTCFMTNFQKYLFRGHKNNTNTWAMHVQNVHKCKDKTFSISHHSRNCMPDHIYKSFTAILNIPQYTQVYIHQSGIINLSLLIMLCLICIYAFNNFEDFNLTLCPFLCSFSTLPNF